MEFTQTQWSIKELLDIYNEDNLNLSPPYQRNFIWSTRDQKELIESIIHKQPVPTLFLYERTEGNFEMVDGQQRSRTILNHISKRGKEFGKTPEEEAFLKYKLPVTIITKVDPDTSIEELYSKLNKTGKHLNNPELRRGEYFESNFLALNEKLAESSTFQELKLFASSSINRMNDVDLVSELTTYLLNGVTDKKESVERIYEKDITVEKAQQIEERFNNIIHIFNCLNEEYPLNKTRFKQRNDFYTLFQFIDNHHQIHIDEFKYFYEELIIFSPHISPADNKCAPLREYARNCVTQSNSKHARNKRYELLQSILMGVNAKPSDEQKEIQSYFKLEKGCYIVKNDYNTFDLNALSQIEDLYA